MRPVLGLACLGLFGLVTGQPAAAGEPPCTKHEQLAGFLGGTYGEQPISAGLQANGRLLEIYSSPSTGSWTAVSTSPSGLACVVATGQGWENRAPAGVSRAFTPALYHGADPIA
jgi:hypothetical protein